MNHKNAQTNVVSADVSCKYQQLFAQSTFISELRPELSEAEAKIFCYQAVLDIP